MHVMISNYETSQEANVKLFVFRFLYFFFFDNVDIFKFYFVLNFEYFMFLIDPLKNNFGADTTLINSYVF